MVALRNLIRTIDGGFRLKIRINEENVLLRYTASFCYNWKDGQTTSAFKNRHKILDARTKHALRVVLMKQPDEDCVGKLVVALAKSLRIKETSALLIIACKVMSLIESPHREVGKWWSDSHKLQRNFMSVRVAQKIISEAAEALYHLSD